MDIMEELQKIFRDIFDDEELVLTEKTSADDIEDWDSLAQIRLVVAIEKHFNVKFAMEEVEVLQDVGGMADLVRSKLG